MSATQLLERIDPLALSGCDSSSEVIGSAVAASVDLGVRVQVSEREDIVSFVEQHDWMLNEDDWRCPYIGFVEDYRAFLRLQVAD